MKKENKKMAQERRAAERKKQQNISIIKKVIIAAIVVGCFLAMIIYGVWESKNGAQDDAEDMASTSDYYDPTGDATEEPALDTDTERVVENGDIVSISYVGSVDGIEFPGGTGDYDLEIGSHSFIDDFEEQLIGHHVGETVEVNVTFPKGYSGTYIDADGNNQSLSDTDALFVVTIHGVYATE